MSAHSQFFSFASDLLCTKSNSFIISNSWMVFLEVKISTARELRAQLREIAPMNSEGSKIFCPNGESAAVTPMMENKCGDRQALPSVYGRTEDIMGNSIPGFAGATGASASTLRAELGAQAYFRDS